MTSWQRALVGLALLGFWTFLTAAGAALVTVERFQAKEITADFLESKVVKGTEEITGPKVVTQDLEVGSTLTAAAVEAQSATVPKLNVPDTLTVKNLSAQQVSVPALLTQSVGDARNLVQAAFIGTLRANAVSTDSVTLTAGGNPVATWTAGGLSLNAPLTITGGAGVFTLDPNAGVLTMKNPGGNELAKITMSADTTLMELKSPAAGNNERALITVKNGVPPQMILGTSIYPPVVPWGIEPVEGEWVEEYQLRYWISADFDFKTTTFWRLKYRITFKNEGATGLRMGLAMLFMDFKDLAWPETYNIPSVEVKRGDTITFSGTLDVAPELADQTRKMKLQFADVQTFR